MVNMKNKKIFCPIGEGEYFAMKYKERFPELRDVFSAMRSVHIEKNVLNTSLKIPQFLDGIVFFHKMRIYDHLLWKQYRDIDAGIIRICYIDGTNLSFPLFENCTILAKSESSPAYSFPLEKGTSICVWRNSYPKKAIRKIFWEWRRADWGIESAGIVGIRANKWNQLPEKLRKIGISNEQEILNIEWSKRISRYRIQEKTRLEEILKIRKSPKHLEDFSPFESVLEIKNNQKLLELFGGKFKSLKEMESYYCSKSIPLKIAFPISSFFGSLIGFEGKSNYTEKAKVKFLSQGKEILQGKFHLWDWNLTINRGDLSKIPWYSVSSSMKPNPDWEFNHALNRHEFLLVLLICYDLTKDDIWSQAIVNFLKDWWSSTSILDGEAGGDNTYFYLAPHRRHGIMAGYAWEMHQTACRLEYWYTIFFRLRNTNKLPPEFLSTFLRHIIEHVWLIYSKENNIHNSNHRLQQLASLIIATTLFNEVPSFEKIRKECLEEIKGYFQLFKARSEKECQKLYSFNNGTLYPDGAMTEVNPVFQSYSAIMVRNVAVATSLIDKTCKPYWENLLTRLHFWQRGIMLPDGYAPPLGQCYHKVDIMREAYLLGDFIHQSDRITQVSQSSFPKAKIKSYAGIYVMRGKKPKDKLYLMCRLGPRAYRNSADWGHIIIYAYGTELLTIPGRARRGSSFEIYTDEYERGPGQSYNTLTIDNLSQRETDRTFRISRPLDVTWITGEDLDFLEGCLSYLNLGLKHYRAILFLKDSGWLIIDRIFPFKMKEGCTPKSHLFRRKFQLPPAYYKKIQKIENGFVSNLSEAANLAIFFPGSSGESQICEGQMEPEIEGWFVLGDDAKPAPAVISQINRSVPVCLYTFLVPLKPNSHQKITVSIAESNDTQDSIVLNSKRFNYRVVIPSGADNFLREIWMNEKYISLR